MSTYDSIKLEGRKEKQIQAVLNMQRKGLTAKDISNYVNLSLEYVEKII